MGDYKLDKMDIQENNKLIAEFMGDDFKTGHGGTIDTLGALKKARPYTWAEYVFFNTSWDWLMPVVEKIESLPLHELIYNQASTRYPSVYMYKDHCIIKDTGDFINANVRDGRGRLWAVYGAVIEFIKWYKEQSYEENIPSDSL